MRTLCLISAFAGLTACISSETVATHDLNLAEALVDRHGTCETAFKVVASSSSDRLEASDIKPYNYPKLSYEAVENQAEAPCADQQIKAFTVRTNAEVSASRELLVRFVSLEEAIADPSIACRRTFDSQSIASSRDSSNPYRSNSRIGETYICDVDA